MKERNETKEKKEKGRREGKERNLPLFCAFSFLLNSVCGGDSSRVRDRLKGVKAIYSSGGAFAAVLQDGSVETWGSPGLEINISL